MSGRGDVCVCGGAGFVGSHLVDRLVADGRTVDVVDDLSTGSLANLAGARRTPERLRIQHLDAGAPEFAEFLALRAPRVVYHLALLTPAAARTAEMLRAATLLLGTLEAARQVGVGKVVVALPATLWYGEVPARHLPVKEGHRTDPMGVGHVVARTIVELLGVYRERHAVEFTAAVLGNVYGPRQRPEDGVVDANLAVHGVPTLHVASSSVFPTSGQANSTFMIVVFALRLAEHLDRKSTRLNSSHRT